MISPLYPAANNDGMMWNAGNLGDRHPQARVTFKPDDGHFTAALAVGQTGAVDRKDLDRNGVRDGEDATLLFVQARVSLEHNKAKIGVWTHWASESTATPVGGETDFTSSAVGIDASITITDMLSVQGEGWLGSNLTDMRGGIGQGVNTTTGKEIASSGGWGQLQLKPNAKCTLFVGASTDTPDEADLLAGGRKSNLALFLVGRYKPWDNFQAAFEYLNWKTEYKGLDDGTANRVDVHFTYYY